MAWSSPRRDREWAAQQTAKVAELHEEKKGRSLTASELKAIHEEMLAAAEKDGRRLRNS